MDPMLTQAETVVPIRTATSLTAVADCPNWVPFAMVESMAEALARIGTHPSVGITSTFRGEGRTTAAAAAAIALSYEFGRKTVLVDLDLTKPGLHIVAGRPLGPGMTELLRGEADLDDCLWWHHEKLGVMTAGSMTEGTPPPLANFGKVLEGIGRSAEVVVADLPPLPPHGPGARLASQCATTLLVVRAGATPVSEIRRAVRTLDIPPPVVINRLQPARRRKCRECRAFHGAEL